MKVAARTIGLSLVILLGVFLTGTAVYQIQQIRDFTNGSQVYIDSCTAEQSGSMCTMYGDRFTGIALASLVSVALSPAIFLWLLNLKQPIGINRLGMIYIAVLVVILFVHLSGAILYVKSGFKL